MCDRVSQSLHRQGLSTELKTLGSRLLSLQQRGAAGEPTQVTSLCVLQQQLDTLTTQAGQRAGQLQVRAESRIKLYVNRNCINNSSYYCYRLPFIKGEQMGGNLAIIIIIIIFIQGTFLRSLLHQVQYNTRIHNNNIL